MDKNSLIKDVGRTSLCSEFLAFHLCFLNFIYLVESVVYHISFLDHLCVDYYYLSPESDDICENILHFAIQRLLCN